MPTTGHCLCGAIKYEYDGPENWSGYCHCASCRRNCSAPVTAYFAIPNGNWRWTGAEPATYRHSDHATRSFCAACGMPMAYATTHLPDETHFYAASLADPEAYRPAKHFMAAERLSWFDVADDLPRTNPGDG